MEVSDGFFGSAKDVLMLNSESQQFCPFSGPLLRTKECPTFLGKQMGVC